MTPKVSGLHSTMYLFIILQLSWDCLGGSSADLTGVHSCRCNHPGKPKVTLFTCWPGCLGLSCGVFLAGYSEFLKEYSTVPKAADTPVHQAFFCTVFADVPLAKARSMAEPSVHVGGNHTGPKSWRPLKSPSITWFLRFFWALKFYVFLGMWVLIF